MGLTLATFMAGNKPANAVLHKVSVYAMRLYIQENVENYFLRNFGKKFTYKKILSSKIIRNMFELQNCLGFKKLFYYKLAFCFLSAN